MGAASVDPAPVDPPPTSPDDPISAMALSASRPGATARCGVGAERCDRAASPSALRGRLISPGSDAGSDLDGDPPPPPPPRLDLPRLEPGRSGTPPADAVKFAAAVMAAIDAAASNGEPTRGAGGVIARPATLGMNHWGLYAGAPAGPAGEDEDVAAANACAAAAAAAAGGWPGSVLTPAAAAACSAASSFSTPSHRNAGLRESTKCVFSMSRKDERMLAMSYSLLTLVLSLA